MINEVAEKAKKTAELLKEQREFGKKIEGYQKIGEIERRRGFSTVGTEVALKQTAKKLERTTSELNKLK